MRRTSGILLAIVAIGVPALIILATRTTPGRILSRSDRVVVQPATGQWYHNYVVQVGVSPSSVGSDSASITSHVTQRVADSLRVTVSRDVFDAARTGAHVRVSHLRLPPRVNWISDSSSALSTLTQLVAARLKSYNNPKIVSPLDAQTSGLARVVAVHRIERRQFFWQKSNASRNRSQWMHLVEVEFWAPRTRSLVRTIDVIDAGSIPGLQAGDVLQMHYDQREPRVVRLDDGRRTFTEVR